LNQESTMFIQPTLFIPEVVASIARKQDSTDISLEVLNDFKKFPNLTLVDLDGDLAEFASEVAASNRLRGSDAVYAAVAVRFGTELITLDKEQLERLPNVLSVRSP
jgi:predicted nucleic acid-binding protein